MTEKNDERVFSIDEAKNIADSIQAVREQEIAWRESVTDNISALIAIVTQAADISQEEYKNIVLRIRSLRDQINAEERDQAAGQAAEPR